MSLFNLFQLGAQRTGVRNLSVSICEVLKGMLRLDLGNRLGYNLCILCSEQQLVKNEGDATEVNNSAPFL